MHPISIVLKDATNKLKNYGVTMPELDSRILLAHYLKVSKEYLIINPDLKLSMDRGYLSAWLGVKQRGLWDMSVYLEREETW